MSMFTSTRATESRELDWNKKKNTRVYSGDCHVDAPIHEGAMESTFVIFQKLSLQFQTFIVAVAVEKKTNVSSSVSQAHAMSSNNTTNRTKQQGAAICKRTSTVLVPRTLRV